MRPRELQVWLLHAADGVPYPDEIARRLGISRHAVECAMSRARKQIQAEEDRRLEVS